MKKKVLPIALILFLVAVDQILKRWAYNYLQEVGQIHVIEGFFSLTYLENTGAAFGIMQGQRWFFVVITIAILASIGLYYKHIPEGKPHNYLRFTMLIIVAGAIGNFIDRLLFGFVIDYLHVTFISFPVFNFADILLVVGAIVFSYITIFVIKDEKKDEK